MRQETRTPSGERADRKRRAIVAAARESFVRDGYEAGMDSIAAHAGVSKVTVYNHFGSKEALFTAVIGEALDQALGDTLTEARARLADTDDIREALTFTARAWVRGVTAPAVLALRNLVAGELRRFPELGHAWQERGPGRFFPVLAEVLSGLSERGELKVADVEVAVLQLYALTLYPHLVYSSYGDQLDPDLAERLITKGVDMFLSYYRA
ncbi:MAG TPA: TetR/AcrR family transcriptional regulator [Micromonosporaceae bacterium]|jgi:AcrR family transcriptional regulator|nr:TetR/AcrR family transcriptional regulator [Micromonosporaceae bacterium]